MGVPLHAEHVKRRAIGWALAERSAPTQLPWAHHPSPPWGAVVVWTPWKRHTTGPARWIDHVARSHAMRGGSTAALGARWENRLLPAGCTDMTRRISSHGEMGRAQAGRRSSRRRRCCQPVTDAVPDCHDEISSFLDVAKAKPVQNMDPGAHGAAVCVSKFPKSSM